MRSKTWQVVFTTPPLRFTAGVPTLMQSDGENCNLEKRKHDPVAHSSDARVESACNFYALCVSSILLLWPPSLPLRSTGVMVVYDNWFTLMAH